MLNWKELEHIAKDNVNFSGKNIIIEVAAQHPLINGIFPGVEFEARLKKGLSIYKELKNEYNVKFFLPGSLHKGDTISLTDAANQWFYKNCVNSMDILHWNGAIYNSIDECRVGAELFFKNKFDRLISICGPAQLHRKALAYIKFGVFPEMVSVNVDHDVMYHSYVDEALIYLPDFLGNETENNKNRELRKNNE